MIKKILYIIFILLLFLLMYWLNKDPPMKYQWRPTYETLDKQPFGAYAFDKILSDSWKDKYYHNYFSISDISSKTAASLDKNNKTVLHPDYNLLIITNNLWLDTVETKYLLNYIKYGSNVIIAAENMSSVFKDTLNFYITNPVFQNILDFNIRMEQEKVNFYSPDSTLNQLIIPKRLIKNGFIVYNKDYVRKEKWYEKYSFYDSLYRISTSIDEKRTFSMRYAIGKGNLILISNPLIFTNYGILNDSINPYIWKHLAYLKGKPLMRTEYYMTGSQGGKSQSIFRVILREKAFRWAFYITLTGILIFMIFTAKRKQKIIPVINPPANKMLDFVRSIAGLYLLKNDNADILLKKQIYWGEELKRKYGIDIINEEHNIDFFKRVGAKTRQPYQEIHRLFLELDAIDETTIVTDEYMLLMIMRMNEL